jgi:hypothetical protein
MFIAKECCLIMSVAICYLVVKILKEKEDKLPTIHPLKD